MFGWLTHHYESPSKSPSGVPDIILRAGGGISLSHHYVLSNSTVFHDMVVKLVKEKKLEMRIAMLQEMINKYER